MSKVLPIIGSILWVLVLCLRTAGAVTEADGLEQFLRQWGIPTTVSPAEIAMAVPVAWGIIVWFRKRVPVWFGKPARLHPPVLKTKADMDSFVRRYIQLTGAGVPWEEARRRALAGVLITHPFPDPVLGDAGTEG